jgi:hypothetical protein
MSRITISLPEDFVALLAREAERAHTSVSDIVRRALGRQFGLTDETTRKLPFAGLGRSGRRHTGRDAEAILAREWGGNVRRR